MIKKKIMFGALAALFLSVGIFAATNLQERKQVSDLTLANIEAMTEIGVDIKTCLGTSKPCKIGDVEGFGTPVVVEL